MSKSCLYTLPFEVLSEILSCLINEKPCLYNLAFQSRHLSEIVRPLLFRCVCLNQSLGKRTFYLFLRSIIESRALASLVLELKLEWGGAREKDYEIIELLLTKLYCLKRLKLSGSSSFYQPAAFRHRFLATGAADSLLSVSVDNVDFSSEELAKYISLPHLESLSILPYTKTSNLHKVFDSRHHSNSTLRKLEIFRHLSISSLRDLLDCFPNLTSVTIYLPGRFWCFEDESEWHRLSEALSPSAISQLSDRTKSKLTDLILVDENFLWPSHDESRMDLSKFTSLKRLDVPSLCYFLTDEMRPSERKDIAHLLPSSLESLKIVYGLDTAIWPWWCLWPDLVKYGYRPTESNLTADGVSLSNFAMTERKTWLTDLANAKQQCVVPNLTRIFFD